MGALLNQAVANQLRQFPQFNPMLAAPPGGAPDLITQALMSLRQRAAPYAPYAAMAIPMILEGSEGEPPEPPPAGLPPDPGVPPSTFATGVLKGRPTTPLARPATMGATEPWQFHGTEALPELEQGMGWHGSPEMIPEMLNPEELGSQNLYDRGLYTTDNYYIAHGYARPRMEGSVRPLPGGEPKVIYRVHQIRPVKFINQYESVPMNVLERLRNNPRLTDADKQVVEDFVSTGERPQLGYMLGPESPWVSRWQVTKAGRESPVRELVPNKAKGVLIDELEKEGYGGMTHIGGQMLGGDEHQVKIYWNPKRDVRLQAIRPSLSERATPMHVAAPVVGPPYKKAQ
jgi:hypothetical protein